ncbi:MAG: hypothetical protein M3Y87_12695 [Myxococcota bacterium]|nr:hypothetical protein [Myxococcota bacterium]
MTDPDIDDAPAVLALFAALERELPRLEELLGEVEDCYEDGLYRFYHQSFKVYHRLQPYTLQMVAALRALAPERPLHPYFEEILAGGTGLQFSPEDNARWTEATRPIVEAFLHARYFLEMAVKYGRELDAPPRVMPSGWASLLYLYGLR